MSKEAIEKSRALALSLRGELYALREQLQSGVATAEDAAAKLESLGSVADGLSEKLNKLAEHPKRGRPPKAKPAHAEDESDELGAPI